MTQAAILFINNALTSLSTKDVQQLLWHHKSMYSWMKVQDTLARSNQLHPSSSEWFHRNESDKQDLLERVKATSMNGAMVYRVGMNLTAILQQKIAPLELMLEQKLMYNYYMKDIRMVRSYTQVKKIIRLLAHQNPQSKSP